MATEPTTAREHSRGRGPRPTPNLQAQLTEMCSVLKEQAFDKLDSTLVVHVLTQLIK